MASFDAVLVWFKASLDAIAVGFVLFRCGSNTVFGVFAIWVPCFCNRLCRITVHFCKTMVILCDIFPLLTSLTIRCDVGVGKWWNERYS